MIRDSQPWHSVGVSGPEYCLWDMMWVC